MYALWCAFIGLFLRRRVVINLRSGQRFVYLRPKNTTRVEYRKTVEEWRAAADRRLKFEDRNHVITVSSSDIVSVEVH